MNYSSIITLIKTTVLVALCSISLQAQLPTNPILFVTVVPNAVDSASQCATFGSHLPSVGGAPRGGDLWIRYPDGSLRNLTKEAGYGMEEAQTDRSIAVREPRVHWSGKKAVFSMVVGCPMDLWDTTHYHWQLYEISGLDKGDSARISIVPNQPWANNISPCYSSDDNIIFCSDRKRDGDTLYWHYCDENAAMRCTSGLWSLNPTTGSIQLLDHAPSGAFRPFVDSYGRVVYTRWDIQQQDQLLAVRPYIIPLTYDEEGTMAKYNVDGSQTAIPETNQRLSPPSNRQSYFDPPLNTKTADSLPGAERVLMDARLPNNFFPWTCNQDGSNVQTINQIGRQDLRDTIPHALSGDPNIYMFRDTATQRANKHPINNTFCLSQDPLHPGSYYAIDAQNALTHTGGQIIRLNNLEPTQTSRAVTVDYVTPRVTRSITAVDKPRDPWHSGFYRNPLATSDGLLVVSHSDSYYPEPNIARGYFTLSNRFAFRLRVMHQVGSYMFPGEYLTQGIKKRIVVLEMHDGARATAYANNLWEMDAVEVIARERPVPHSVQLDSIEAQVFADEGVNIWGFTRYLQEKKQALVVSRNVTLRDQDDKLQPYYLRVAGTNTQTPNAKGKVYDVNRLDFYQGDYRRAHQDETLLLYDVRRVIQTPMHEATNRPYDSTSIYTSSSSNVGIERDGSIAAFVPAERALTWQLTNSNNPVVRERYWLTFKAGEIRVCMKCHGENQESPLLREPVPTNKALALRGLLRVWKQDNLPGAVTLVAPKNFSTNVSFPLLLKWTPMPAARRYVLSIYAKTAEHPLVFQRTVEAPTFAVTIGEQDLSSTAAEYTWDVRAMNDWGSGSLSHYFQFSTNSTVSVEEDPDFADIDLFPNPAHSQLRVRCIVPDNTVCQLELINSLGRVVLTQQSTPTAQQLDVELALDALPEGPYYLRLHSASRQRVLPLNILR